MTWDIDYMFLNCGCAALPVASPASAAQPALQQGKEQADPEDVESEIFRELDNQPVVPIHDSSEQESTQAHTAQKGASEEVPRPGRDDDAPFVAERSSASNHEPW